MSALQAKYSDPTSNIMSCMIMYLNMIQTFNALENKLNEFLQAKNLKPIDFAAEIVFGVPALFPDSVTAITPVLYNDGRGQEFVDMMTCLIKEDLYIHADTLDAKRSVLVIRKEVDGKDVPLDPRLERAVCLQIRVGIAQLLIPMRDGAKKIQAVASDCMESVHGGKHVTRERMNQAIRDFLATMSSFKYIHAYDIWVGAMQRILKTEFKDEVLKSFLTEMPEGYVKGDK